MNKIILAGNPNTGKTTLFNTLTKSREHASNWHGVTTAVKEKSFANKKEYLLCDLPGLYSLDGYSEEEKIASSYISENSSSTIICLADANNLRRNLLLFFELKKLSSKVVLAINMAGENKSINIEKLEAELGAKVFLIDARKKKTLKDLMQEIERLEGEKNLAKPCALQGEFSLEKFNQKCRSNFENIDKILDRSGYQTKGFYGYSKVDKFLLNGFFGSICFVLVMALVFFITFGLPGSALSSLVSDALEQAKNWIIYGLSQFISSTPLIKFIEEGVLGGICTVLGFLPQIVLLFLCLNFLEDIGYLSRTALLFDRVFKKVGLNGRSVFSLIMGFGCTTSAVTTTRGLDNADLKKRTALVLPFMSCSAKLPIYAVICSAFFAKHKALMVFLLYFLGSTIAILVLLFLRALSPKKEQTFMMELPKYRFPNFRKICSSAFVSAKDFLVRVGGILLISSMVVFALYNFSPSLRFVGERGEGSILFYIAKFLKYLFVPLGFGSVGAVIAILSGLVAKEMVVSSLSIVNKVSLGALAESLVLEASPVHFTFLSAISFLVFVLLYPPCLSALFSISREMGKKSAIKSLVLSLIIAYVSSFLVYNIGRLFTSSLWWLGIIVLIMLALAILIMLKCIKGKQSYNLEAVKLKCQVCKEKCEWK